MLSLILLSVLTGPFLTRACHEDITSKIVVKKDGVMEYIKDKTFIDVYFGGNYWLKGKLSEGIACTWAVSENSKITYKRKKWSRIGERRLYERIANGEWKTTVTEDPLTMEVNDKGVITESNKKNKDKYLVFPIYLNQEAGVYAYHRCTVSDNVLTNMWWTVITVDNEKFGNPPMQVKDPNTWPAVEKAFEIIKKIEKIKDSEVFATFKNPDRCVFNKKWPLLEEGTISCLG